MVDTGSGARASETSLRTVSLRVPPMSKAERLYRWADSLEARAQLQLDDDLSRNGSSATATDGSPLTVAAEDWAFQAEGLGGDGLEEAAAFFDLPESELRQIVAAPEGSRAVSAALAARRLRTLARQAEAPWVPSGDAGPAESRAVRSASTQRSIRASSGRHERRAAAAAPRASMVKPRTPGAAASSRRYAS